MVSQRGGLCAALLLLHALALATVSCSQQQMNPRGWQAAREAERRAAHRLPQPGAAAKRQAAAEGPPAAGPAAGPAATSPFSPSPPVFQQACSLSGRPEYEALQQASQHAVVTAAVAAFALGLLCGALLHRVLHRWQQRRRQQQPYGRALDKTAAAGRAEQQRQPEAVVPCAESGATGAQDEAEEQRTLRPTGPADGPANSAVSAEQAEATEQETAAAAEAAGSTLGGAAAAAAARAAEEREEDREGVGESAGAGAGAERGAAAAPEAAVAAAVQELVLKHSAAGSRGGGGGSAPSSGGSRRAAGRSSSLEPYQGAEPKQQQERQDLRGKRSSEEGEGLLAVSAGTAGAGAGAGGALGMLRSEDQGDVAAAAQLVLTMCSSLQVDPGELSRGERLQLIYTMLQAWQAQQARRHSQQMHRLGSEANVLRSEQRDIAAQQAARQAARDAYRLSLERTADFRRMCSDTLTFGLAVMLAAGAYQLHSRGLLAGVTAGCGSWAAALGGRRWGLWGVWRAAETAACYAMSVGDALLGLAVLLAAPWLVYRSGLMSDYHTMPVSKLFIGLGMFCGLAGFLAVGKLGGSRATWLAAWEAWVALHIALSAAAHRMQRIALRAQQSAEAAEAGSMYEHGGGWLSAVMWVGLGLVLPALAGTLPFR